MKQLSEELQWPAGVGCSHRLGRGGMRGRLPCRCSAAARTRRPPLPLHAWSVLASLPSLPGAWAFDGRKNMRVGPGREGVPALAWARAGASKHASVQPESVPLGAACPCARLSLHGRACRRYAPFAQLVPKNEIQHEVLLPRWGHYTLFRKRGGGGVGLLRGRSLRAGLQEAAPDPPQPRRCPCLGAINCMPTPSCRRRRPPPPLARVHTRCLLTWRARAARAACWWSSAAWPSYPFRASRWVGEGGGRLGGRACAA